MRGVKQLESYERSWKARYLVILIGKTKIATYEFWVANSSSVRREVDGRLVISQQNRVKEKELAAQHLK